MNISRTTAGASALVAAAGAAALGVFGLVHEQSAVDTTVGIEHLFTGIFSIVLVALAIVVLRLGHPAGASRAAAISATGLVVLSALTASSNINGEDFGIFPIIAVPANLAIFGGMIAVAVRMRRAGAPMPMAAGLPLSWICMLPLAMVGGGILAAAYYAFIAYTMLARGRVPARDIHPVAA